VAAEPNTTVLAIGGKPGEPFTPSAWEHYFAADAVAKGGDLDEAYDLLMTGLAEHPGDTSILYNAACYRALAGRGDEAIELMSQAFAGNPDAVRNWAAGDSDLDSIRDRPDWPVTAT
jgi:tetratricopeptide (TPR) repeat protein